MSSRGRDGNGGGELWELFRLFTKLGFVGVGGPAAHVAMMREEVVTRRGWMGDQGFLDLNGATNLIPGPNSTELAIHIGRERAGWRGLVVAGTCFIVPAVLIVLAFAALSAIWRYTPLRDFLTPERVFDWAHTVGRQWWAPIAAPVRSSRRHRPRMCSRCRSSCS